MNATDTKHICARNGGLMECITCSAAYPHDHMEGHCLAEDGATACARRLCQVEEVDDEYTCACGDPVSHKDADSCLACAIDDAYEKYREGRG